MSVFHDDEIPTPTPDFDTATSGLGGPGVTEFGDTDEDEGLLHDGD